MADVVEQIVNATVNATAAENATEILSGAKTPATPEGAAVAYGSLIVMAMLPIFFGALRSVKHQKDQKVNDRTHTSSNTHSSFQYTMTNRFRRSQRKYFAAKRNVCRGKFLFVHLLRKICDRKSYCKFCLLMSCVTNVLTHISV